MKEVIEAPFCSFPVWQSSAYSQRHPHSQVSASFRLTTLVDSSQSQSLVVGVSSQPMVAFHLYWLWVPMVQIEPFVSQKEEKPFLHPDSPLQWEFLDFQVPFRNPPVSSVQREILVVFQVSYRRNHLLLFPHSGR